MADTNPHLVSIFGAALDFQSAEEQAAYVERACGDDVELRARVAALLQAHQEAGHFLEGHSRQQEVTTADTNSIVEGPGAAVGPYKLLEQIGEGGMGVVYMADQQVPVRRRVALKIIKPGMDTRRVIARFEAERQALALMDHPNIARVLDAGATESGRPYFVMELVRGVPITEYCDQNNLPVPERLELFGLVCQAVQHAHQKGIIHRDIKPSNVLITLHDGRPVPKVIDFGIAKATGQQLTDKTLFTDFNQLIGTPLYMSPEQAELSGLDIDTRSDIYSLGVLLYELLTGTTPHERERLREAAYDEVRRIIREEDPPKPSTRASSLEHSRPSVAAMRHTEPRKLYHLLQGDLDWIVMKALEKDRTRRYETAAGLAADVRRHLSDQPVEACPPSAAYRLRKLARRNRAALTTAAVVLTALVLGTVVSTWQAIRATRAERLADARLDAEVVARAAEVQQRKVAEEQRREAEKQRAVAEANFQKARQAVDEYFTLVSESKLLDVPGLQPLRRDLLEAALRFYKQSANQRSSDPDVQANLAVTYLRVAEIYHATDRNEDALAVIGQALDTIDRLRREHPAATEAHRKLAGFWKGLRRMKRRTERPRDTEQALRLLQRLADTWEHLAVENPSVVEFQSDLGAIQAHIGDLLTSAGQAEPSRAYFLKARATWETLVRDNPNVPAYKADLAMICYQLGMRLRTVGQAVEADALLRRSFELREQLVKEFPKVPEYRSALAESLIRHGLDLANTQPQEAKQAYRRAVDLDIALVEEFPTANPYHESLAQDTNIFINFLMSSGRTEEAESMLGRMFALIEQHAAGLSSNVDPEDVFVLGEIPRGVGFYFLGHSQPANAEKALLMGVKLFEDALLNPRLAQDEKRRWRYLFVAADTHRALGHAIGQQGKSGEAEEHFRKAIELSSGLPAAFFPANPECRPYVAPNYFDYGNFLRTNNRLDDAAAVLRQGVDYFARLNAELPNEATLRQGEAELRFLLGDVLLQTGKPDAAQAEWTKSLALYRQLADQNPKEPSHRTRLSDTHWKIATILKTKGQIGAAIEAGQQAVDENRKLVQAFPDQTGHRVNLANLQRELSDMLRAADRAAEAAEDFTASCDLYKKLDAEFPNEPDYRNRLRGNYIERAAALASQAKHAEAEVVLRQAMQTFDELAAAHPTAPDYRRLSALFQARLARLLTLTDRTEEAKQTLQVAIDSHQKIIEEFPQYKDLGLVYLNLAILRSAADQSEQAEAAYKKGVELVGNNADVLNDFAWRFATGPEPRFRQPRWAVEVAQKALEQDPQRKKVLLNTLGVAQYRAEKWQDAIATLDQALKETNGGTSFDFFFLAMAEWQLGNKDAAQRWYAQAIEWMGKHRPENEELRRFRAEAQELLGIEPGKASQPDAPAPAAASDNK